MPGEAGAGPAGSRQYSPAAAIPSPTPENSTPAMPPRPSAASQPSPQALVATRVQALATPARKRSSAHAGTEPVQPTAAVIRTVATRPSASSALARSRMRPATSAPSR